MNNLDLFFSAAVSLEMEGAFAMSGEDGEPVFLFDDETYFIPSLFENHLKAAPAPFWPREFRRANDLIKERAASLDGEQWEGVPVCDILESALICLYDLSREMVPEISEELKPGLNPANHRAQDIPDNFPPEIVAAAPDNKTVMALFGALETAGFLDHDWKPTSSAPTNRDKAFMARALAQLLGLYDWAVIFSRYWNVPNLSQHANRAKITSLRKDIEKALADAVAADERLSATNVGKKVMKKYNLAPFFS